MAVKAIHSRFSSLTEGGAGCPAERVFVDRRERTLLCAVEGHRYTNPGTHAMPASTAGRNNAVPPLSEESYIRLIGDLILQFTSIQHLHDTLQIGAVAVGDLGVGA
jgi:hypothetical protein